MPEPLRIAFWVGLGDIAWSCTKLTALRARHPGRPVHAYCNASPNHASWDFLAMVPGIDAAEYSERAPFDVWRDLEGTHRDPRWSSLEGSRNWHGFDYVAVCNGHLERGEPLATWWPELETEYQYPLQVPAAARAVMAPATEGKVLLYPSGTAPNWDFHANTWRLIDWVDVILGLNRHGITPVLVGANTFDDLSYGHALRELTDEEGGRYVNLIGRTSIPEYVAAIEGASCWVGLNSGGGVISGMRGTPTVMLWSDTTYPIPEVRPTTVLHPNMQHSWLSPAQLATYRSLSFGSPELCPGQVIARVLEVMR